jgi:hypothetical protein
VIALANGAKSGEEVIARSVFVVKRLVSQPVGKGVYAKGGLHQISSKLNQNCKYLRGERKPIEQLQQRKSHPGSHPILVQQPGSGR